jgi:hypothetical protein
MLSRCCEMVYWLVNLFARGISMQSWARLILDGFLSSPKWRVITGEAWAENKMNDGWRDERERWRDS